MIEFKLNDEGWSLKVIFIVPPFLYFSLPHLNSTSTYSRYFYNWKRYLYYQIMSTSSPAVSIWAPISTSWSQQVSECRYILLRMYPSRLLSGTPHRSRHVQKCKEESPFSALKFFLGGIRGVCSGFGLAYIVSTSYLSRWSFLHWILLLHLYLLIETRAI